MAAEGDLITLSDYQTFVGDSDASKATQRTQLIGMASAACRTYCDRGLGAGDRVEYHQGDGAVWLHVDTAPVNSISQITFGPYDADPDVVSGSNFYADNAGTIRFRGDSTAAYSHFPCGVVLKVEYNGGYSPVPDDLKLACCLVVQALETLADPEVSVTEKTVRDVKIKYGFYLGDLTNPIFGTASRILDRYRTVACI